MPIRCAPTLPVAQGELHTLAAISNSTVQTWGDDASGELGDNQSGGQSTTPVAVQNLSGVGALAAGYFFSMALKNDGTVWTWGDNFNGQLGNGTTTDVHVPMQVAGLPTITQIAAGWNHSVALSSDGTVWAWGANQFGQLGINSTTPSTVPVQVPGLSGITAIAANENNTMALASNGVVWAWGDNESGEIGDGTTTEANVPTQVRGIGAASAIAVGGLHSLAVVSGNVWTWGYDFYGQLGNNTNGIVTQVTPVEASNLSGVASVSAGDNHSLALTSGGSVYAWGANYSGQLGIGSTAQENDVPALVGGLPAVAAVAGHGDQAVVATSGGAVDDWGANGFGQLGNGTTAGANTPVLVSGITQAVPAAPTNVSAVAGNGLVYLTWNAPSSVLTQYVVTPFLNGVAQPDLATNGTSLNYTLQNATRGNAYGFVVSGQNCQGQGAGSQESNLVVPTGVQLDEANAKIEAIRLNDRMDLHVNAFNGNLGLHERDLRIKGTGLNLAVDRTYNSLASSTSIFGRNWFTTVGSDIKLTFPASNTVYFNGPGGFQVGFAKNTDGSFASPSGIDATLIKNADSSYTLTFHSSGEQYGFSSTGAVLTEKDKNGNTISFAYAGPSGTMSSITDTQGRVTAFAYNASNLVSTITDPTSRTFRYTYDTNSNLISYTDPDNGLTKFAYDSSNRLTQVTDPVNRVVAIAYDTSNRVVSISHPLTPGNPTTRFSYASGSTVVTDPNTNATTYKFDPVGRPTGAVDALGNTQSASYTSDSNVSRYQGGAGDAVSFGYDTNNNLTGVDQQTGATSTAVYADSRHPFFPTGVTDPQGNSLALAYDTAGNILSESDSLPSQNQVAITYNANGTPATSKDPNGNLTTYGYDTHGNLTSIVPPAPLGQVAISYDSLSRITSVVDGKGQRTSYTYDGLDRVLTTTYADNSSVVRVYDGDGNITSLTDASGQTLYTYDTMNRLVQRLTPDGKTVAYTYDGEGNLMTFADPGGTTTYAYNPVNLASTIASSIGVFSATYDASYNRTSLAYPDGITMTWTYDASNRATRASAVGPNLPSGSQTLFSLVYNYTSVANGLDTDLRQSVTDASGNVTAYIYDTLNRLIDARTTNSAGVATSEYHYTYDGAGNRLTQIVNNGGVSMQTPYTYNSANEMLTQAGVSFTYDQDGNVTSSSDGASLTYDAANRTTSLRPVGGTTASFTYRGVGQSERTGEGPVPSTNAGQVCALIVCSPPPSSTQTTTTTFEYSSLGITAQTDGTLPTYFIRDSTGGLLGEHTPTANYYYLRDTLGSVVGLANAQGVVAGSYTYDPFGQTLTATGVAAASPWRFAGQYLDGTGLYKMGERYYDPSLGRWTQQDPIAGTLNPLQWNRYVYVGDNPINLVDSTGLNACDQVQLGFWEIVGGIGLVVAVGAAILAAPEVSLPLFYLMYPEAAAAGASMIGGGLYLEFKGVQDLMGGVKGGCD